MNVTSTVNSTVITLQFPRFGSTRESARKIVTDSLHSMEARDPSMIRSALIDGWLARSLSQGFCDEWIASLKDNCEHLDSIIVIRLGSSYARRDLADSARRRGISISFEEG
jgi:hypothetical protein